MTPACDQATNLNREDAKIATFLNFSLRASPLRGLFCFAFA
jgi:hypothetical protein